MSFALYLVALGLVLVSGAPLASRDVVGVSSAQLDDFELFSQYSAAAYCFNTYQSAPGSLITCTADQGSCADVEAAGAKLLAAFSVNAGTSTQGYVAQDDKNKLLIVSYQGTQINQNPVDILTDLDITQTDTDLCGAANKLDGCQVHRGFYRSMKDSMSFVQPALTAAIASNPSYKVVITGHSLGGAIAALLGTELRNSGIVLDLYTYGQPRLGGRDISLYVQSQAPASGNNFRITHSNDIVPQIPPRKLKPEWDHYFPEFWVDTDNLPVLENDIKQVNATLTSKNGNEGDTSGFGLIIDAITGFKAHKSYFGHISGCNSVAP